MISEAEDSEEYHLKKYNEVKALGILDEEFDEMADAADSREDKRIARLIEKEKKKAERLAKKEAAKREKVAALEAELERDKQLDKLFEEKEKAKIEEASEASAAVETDTRSGEGEASNADTSSASFSQTEGSDAAEVPSDKALSEGNSDGDSGSDSDGDSEEKDILGFKGKKKKSRKDKEDADEINIVKDLISLFIYIVVVILICFCVIRYVGQRSTVDGSSMLTTLEDGDNLWIDKFTYHFKLPERFDIVVFPYQDTDTLYIKRVIGLPGETVQITPTGDILINGVVLEEHYCDYRIENPGIASSPITLGEDEFFVMGDNRNNSKDSRFSDVGNIKRDSIIGKAVFRITPLKKIGRVE